MNVAVLDASVVLKWFATRPENSMDAAQRLRAEFASGRLEAFVPRLVLLEVLNVVARRWQWPAADVTALAEALEALPWQVSDPPLRLVARWVGRGLTAYDATYAALAEWLGVPLMTDDKRLLDVAGTVARPLARD